MALREARVLEVLPGGLRLQPLGEACRDCRLGCGGRCQVFRADDGIELPWDGAAPCPGPGDVVCLRLEDDTLGRLAWLGYGRVLVGLLAGAALGHGLGLLLEGPENLFALVGLLLGTLAAASFSKPSPRAGLGIEIRRTQP